MSPPENHLKRFYLSPNDYPGPQTPVGELNPVIDPAVVRSDYSSNWVVEKALSADDILSMAVSGKQLNAVLTASQI